MNGDSDFAGPLGECPVGWIEAQAWQALEQELLELARLAEAD